MGSNQIIESFKRLYKSEKISEEKLNSLVEKDVISQDEKEYIIRKDGE